MKIINRKFRRELEEIETYEAGIILSGAEVKSVKAGGLRLDDAYVKILDDGPYLINAEISPYRFAKLDNYDSKRSRKLLLHQKELLRLQVKMRGGGNLTLVPVSCYNKGRIIKVQIALARGRREVEKRKYEKQRTIQRESKREAKEYLKR